MYVAPAGWTSDNFDSTNAHGRYFVKNTSTPGAFGDYDPSRVTVNSQGDLQLQVLGTPNTTTRSTWSHGSMIDAAWEDIRYGSVRTVMKGTISPGSVYGTFFIALNHDYNGETDIELRTSYSKQTWDTNQQVYCVGTQEHNPEAQQNSFLSHGTMADAFHEYHIDWLPGKTSFYLDGTHVTDITQYVPASAGIWHWNAWR